MLHSCSVLYLLLTSIFHLLSSFQMLTEATEDNLIDLGPGSPAVVTPRITSSPPPSSTVGAMASPARNPTAASLSSALAGLGKDKT